MLAPLAVLWVYSEVVTYTLPTAAVLLIALGFAIAISTLAAQIWNNRPVSEDISFGELMIWSWYRLQKAERNLELGQLAVETTTSHEEKLEVLQELSAALESKDPYTRGHARRVERHSFMVGVAMGLPMKDVEVLRMAASLHDVGKIRIPNSILHNPGRLSDEERVVINEHPVLGSEMVADTGDPRIIETVRHHHERWDGGGYPDRIAGADIPLFSRIIAVADSYDAITSTRSYRAAGSRDKALGILREESDHQFDPKVVEAFMTTLPARRPMVAALMFLTGSGAIWRHFTMFLQRFGSVALAPAIGALGTALIVATPSFLTPGDGVSERSWTQSEPSTSSEAFIVSGEMDLSVPTRGAALSAGAVRSTSDLRTTGRRDGKRSEARKDRNRPDARRLTAAAATSDTQADSAPGTDTSGARGDGSGSTSDESGTSSGTTSADHESVDDPNAEGRDCKSGYGKPSKGSRLHCN